MNIFDNEFVWIPFLTWLAVQTFKVITELVKNKKFNATRILGAGGMPSSHSATVMALCTACVIQEGVSSPLFAICFVLAVIVMIDASGVRYETGKQAKIINKITSELFSGKADEFNTGLKELVGHTPFQVIVGAILGIVVAIILGLIL